MHNIILAAWKVIPISNKANTLQIQTQRTKLGTFKSSKVKICISAIGGL